MTKGKTQILLLRATSDKQEKEDKVTAVISLIQTTYKYSGYVQNAAKETDVSTECVHVCRVNKLPTEMTVVSTNVLFLASRVCEEICR